MQASEAKVSWKIQSRNHKFLWSLVSTSQNHARNSCRQEVGEGASNHCAYAERSQVVPPGRCQCANAAHLDGNGAKISESTQCESRDDEGALIEAAAHLSELKERNKLIQHQSRPK